MPMPCARRSCTSADVSLQLFLAASPEALTAVLSEIRLRVLCASPCRFTIDCAGTKTIPAQRIEALLELRDELRAMGSDLGFMNCDSGLRQTLNGGQLSDSVADLQPARHEPHPLRGPHPRFVQMFRAKG
jgi:hypothetical protein